MGLFNVLAGLLLLCCACVFVLWIGERSNWGDPFGDFEEDR